MEIFKACVPFLWELIVIIIGILNFRAGNSFVAGLLFGSSISGIIYQLSCLLEKHANTKS